MVSSRRGPTNSHWPESSRANKVTPKRALSFFNKVAGKTGRNSNSNIYKTLPCTVTGLLVKALVHHVHAVITVDGKAELPVNDIRETNFRHCSPSSQERWQRKCLYSYEESHWGKEILFISFCSSSQRKEFPWLNLLRLRKARHFTKNFSRNAAPPTRLSHRFPRMEKTGLAIVSCVPIWYLQVKDTVAWHT